MRVSKKRDTDSQENIANNIDKNGIIANKWSGQGGKGRRSKPNRFAACSIIII